MTPHSILYILTHILHILYVFVACFGLVLVRNRAKYTSLLQFQDWGRYYSMNISAKHNMDISFTLFVGFGGLEKGRLL